MRLFFQGTTTLTVPAGDGILCTNASLRYSVNMTNVQGETSQSGLGVNAIAGEYMNSQYWFQDAANTCGGGFNFTNGWTAG